MAFRYAELNSTKKHVDREMKGIRQELLDFTGSVFKGRSDTVDLIVSTVDPSLIVDGELLRQHYPDIYNGVLKERAGYTKLEVKQAKQATV